MRIKKTMSNLFLIIFCCISFLSFNNDALALGELNREYLNSIQNNRLALPVVDSVSLIENKDIALIKITPGTNQIKGIKVGTSLSTSRWYEISSDSTGSISLYVSMMNGKQNVWAVDTAGNHSVPYSIEIINSCTEEGSVTNGMGKGKLKKCAIYTNGNYKLAYPGSITCADGYSLQSDPSYANLCNTITQSSLDSYHLTDRYCSIIYSYNCVKDTQDDPESVTSYLNSLSISSGTLSPSFKATTLNYTASVNVSAITVSASLNGDGSSFVSGYGPRTVKLNYGANNILVKVQSSTGNVKIYTIKVTRIDNRSKDNTLSSLSTSVGTLSPSFSKATTTYNVNVDQGVTSIDVKAVLSDSKASFVSGYGPRTVSLKEGNNVIQIKVKSEALATKTYTINVNRATSPKGDEPTPKPEVDTSKLALLESLTLSEGNIAFDSNVFEYTVYVNYEVTQVIASAKAKDSNDKITVNGGENLEVAEEEQITVTVLNEENNFSRTYTVNVIRKEEEIKVSSNSKLSNIVVKGHKLDFDAETYEYKITLGKDENELEIEATPEDSKSTVLIDGNSDLDVDSKITITVTAEDGSVSNYYLIINGRKKGVNVFLVIVLILIIILVIAYMVLRLLGYKIYVNFSLIGSFFRSIGEKIRNIFDRR